MASGFNHVKARISLRQDEVLNLLDRLAGTGRVGLIRFK